MYFDCNFTDVFNWSLVSTSLGRNLWQAIAWDNSVPDRWCIYAAPDVNMLKSHHIDPWSVISEWKNFVELLRYGI